MNETDQGDLLCLDLAVAEEIRREIIPQAPVQVAATRAQALSDPTRVRLLSALAAADELCVCDLAWICARPQNLVSHHLRVLRAQELVQRRRDGKMLMYSVTESGRRLLEALTGSAERSIQ